jgi:hypothetical protein
MYINKKLITLILFLSGVMLISCDQDVDSNGNSSSMKPKARGAIGEILLVVDSLKWQGPVGDALKDVFQEDLKGLIRDESLFTIRRVDPRAMTRILRMASNIVFVTTFDDKKPGSQSINAQFTSDVKEKAAEDPSFYFIRSEDEFAQGQEVIYLFGENEAELVENLKENKNRLQNLFQVRERKRMANLLLKRKNSAAKEAGRTLGIEVNVPASYQIGKSEEDFLWLRQPTPSANRPDISLFFYETDYTSEEQVFPESIIQLREKIAKMHIYGDPNNRNSYLTVEKADPSPVFNNFSINSNFAVEVRGGWKTNNLSMGGSFLAYVLVDSDRGKLYYMEGFVYYPNETHRESIREIETILLATEIIPEEENVTQ